MTASTGDLWQAFNGLSSTPFNPLYLSPGACGNITLTVMPTSPAGTHVSGTLYVDDFVLGSFLNPSTVFIPSNFGLGILPSGDQLLAIPYAYNVS